MISARFDSLKDQLKEISAIAATVPEEFRQKCFELLLAHVLGPNGHASGTSLASLVPAMASPTLFVASAPGYSGPPPMTALLAAFVKKIGLSAERFHRVIGYSHGSVVFLREPDSVRSAQAQLEWALLLALKNAVVKGSFAVGAEEVRLICQEKGVYDRRSFAANFRRYADHFRAVPEPAGRPQPLATKGLEALGTLVKALAEQAN